MNKNKMEDEVTGINKEDRRHENINLSAPERRELVISELKRKHRVRIIMQGISLLEFREIIERLESVYIEIEAEQQNREELEKNRRSDAEKIIADMSLRGLDIHYLNDVIISRVEADNARYMKDGVKWSGQGRRPDAFKGLGAVELERHRIPVKK